MNKVPAPFAARLARLRSEMKQAGCDLYLCDHAEMLAWLTGYTVSETFYRAAIVPAVGDPVWILRAIDEVPCRAATWLDDIVTYADHEDAHAIVAQAIDRFRPAVIGADFSSYGFTHATFLRLSELLSDARFVDLPGSANILRAVKDEQEIAYISAAAAIADSAMETIRSQLAPGMRPRDAAAIAAHHYLSNGADDYWVGPISISRRAKGDGHDMGFLHATISDERLAAGDVLHVELVPRISNYSARFMRSISLGAPSAALTGVMDRLVALQDAQFAAMIPGTKAKAADAILREGLLTEGLRTAMPNISGYQVGLYAKTPRSSDTSLCLHETAEWEFEIGQTFHVYATAQGLALSETVVIEPEGARRLTQTERCILIAGG